MVRREFRFLSSLLFIPSIAFRVSSGTPEGLPPFPPGSPTLRMASGFCPAPSPLPFSSTALRTCPPDCHPHQWFPSPGGPGSQGSWFQEPWLGLRWGGGSSGYGAQVLSSEHQLSWLGGDRTASSQWLRLLHSAPLRFSWVGPRGSYSLAGRGPQEPYSSLFSFPH